MKKNLKYCFVAITSLFLILIFSGCDFFMGPTYDFWLDKYNYSELVEENSSISNLGDGYYYFDEMDEEEFSLFNCTTSTSGYTPMTEAQLKSYLINLGFDTGTADEVKKGFLNNTHAIMFSRTGNVVYVIIK
ncbi:MAG: hypothetical protein K5866_09620 [Treponema sp.]|nr:hypothetical protein [Treponema sp.]